MAYFSGLGPGSHLAGMVVATDPYAFEDDPDDPSFFPVSATNNANDQINLKNGPQGGMFDQMRHPQQNNFDNWSGHPNPNHMFKNEVS